MDVALDGEATGAEMSDFEAEFSADAVPVSPVLGDSVAVEAVREPFWEDGIEPSWFCFTD